MSQFKKSYEKIKSKASDGNWTFDELCHLVEKLGFSMAGGSGSHRVYTKDGVTEIINLQEDTGGKAKKYQVGQVRDLISKYSMVAE